MTIALRYAEGKDPSDVWDYSLDFTDAMAKAGDTLASVSVTASPSTITVGSTSTTPAGMATVRLSGGTAAVDYTITYRATTAAGRVIERSVMLLVRNL